MRPARTPSVDGVACRKIGFGCYTGRMGLNEESARQCATEAPPLGSRHSFCAQRRFVVTREHWLGCVPSWASFQRSRLLMRGESCQACIVASYYAAPTRCFAVWSGPRRLPSSTACYLSLQSRRVRNYDWATVCTVALQSSSTPRSRAGVPAGIAVTKCSSCRSTPPQRPHRWMRFLTALSRVCSEPLPKWRSRPQAAQCDRSLRS